MASKKGNNSKETSPGDGLPPITERYKKCHGFVCAPTSDKAEKSLQQHQSRGGVFEAPRTKSISIKSRLLREITRGHQNRTGQYRQPLLTSGSQVPSIPRLQNDQGKKRTKAANLRQENPRGNVNWNRHMSATDTNVLHSTGNAERRGRYETGPEKTTVCFKGNPASQGPNKRRKGNKTNNASNNRSDINELSPRRRTLASGQGLKRLISSRPLHLRESVQMSSETLLKTKESAHQEGDPTHPMRNISEKFLAFGRRLDMHPGASIGGGSSTSGSHLGKEDLHSLFPCGTPMCPAFFPCIIFKLSCLHCLSRGWVHSVHGGDYKDEQVRKIWTNLPHHADYKGFFKDVMHKRNLVFSPAEIKTLDRHAKCFPRPPDEEETKKEQEEAAKDKANYKHKVAPADSGVKLLPASRPKKQTYLTYSSSLNTVFDAEMNVSRGKLSPTTATYLLYQGPKPGAEERIEQVVPVKPEESSGEKHASYTLSTALRLTHSRHVPLMPSKSMAGRSYGISNAIAQFQKLTEACRKALHGATTELDADIQQPFVPDQPKPNLSPHEIRLRPVVKRCYSNNKTFALMLPDGTGNLYYPSGNVAMVVTSEEVGHFSYVVVEEEPLEQSVVAYLGSSGNGFCSWTNGIPRIAYGGVGGLELDRDGNKKRDWAWWTLKRFTFQLRTNFAVDVKPNKKVDIKFGVGSRQCTFHAWPKAGYQWLLPQLAQAGGWPEEAGSYVTLLVRLRRKIQRSLRGLARLLGVPDRKEQMRKLPHLRCRAQSLQEQGKLLRKRRELAARLPPLPNVVRVH